jgi:probable rRNA maturation factor
MERRPRSTRHWPPEDSSNAIRLSVALHFMKISLSNVQKDLSLKGKASSISLIVQEVMTEEKQKLKELSLVFVTDRFMRRLHLDFFNDPTPTDVITFPLEKESAEIYICPKIAKTYASLHDQDPYRELTLYIVHGLLHLAGFDDLDPKKRKEMRKSEKKHMNHLMKKNLILSS